MILRKVKLADFSESDRSRKNFSTSFQDFYASRWNSLWLWFDTFLNLVTIHADFDHFFYDGFKFFGVTLWKFCGWVVHFWFRNQIFLSADEMGQSNKNRRWLEGFV